mgnify:CR=1 FL=1
MSDPFVELLAQRFQLNEDDKKLLSLCETAMTRAERRRYQRQLAPRLGVFRTYLDNIYRSKNLAGETTPDEWATRVASNVVRKGYAGIIDSILLEIIGRRQVSARVKLLKRLKGRR